MNLNKGKVKKEDVNIIAVLGMHRSGTSCLAGCLQAAGINLKEYIDFSIDNLKGNRENQEIMRLNDSLLKANNASWSTTPSSVIFEKEFISTRNSIIQHLKSENNNFLFKDPRTLLLLDFWRFDIKNINFVGTFRDPSDVVASLFMREEITIMPHQGLKLWIDYNQNLLRLYKIDKFPIIYFGSEAGYYLNDLKYIITDLKKKSESLNHLKFENAKHFFDYKLKNNLNFKLIGSTPQEKKLIQKASEIYQELKAISISSNFKSQSSPRLSIPLSTKIEVINPFIAKTNPSQFHSYLAAKIHELNGNQNKAISILKKQINESFNKIEYNILFFYGKLLIQSNEIELVKTIFKELKPDKLTQKEIHFLKFHLNIDMNRIEDAIEELSLLAEKNKNSKKHFSTLIFNMFKYKVFDKISELEPEIYKNAKFDPRLLAFLAIANFRLKKYKDVRKHIDSFKKMTHKEHFLMPNLNNILKHLKKLKNL